MTATGSNLDPGAGPPAAPPASQLSRALRTFTEPAAVFKELAAKPTWIVALLIIVVAGFALQLVVAPRVDMEATIRQSMEDRQAGKVDEAQLEQAVDAAAKIGKVTMFVSPVVAPVMFLLIAGVYFLGLKVLGSDGQYLSVFSTYLHAIFPSSLVSSVLIGAVALQRESFPAQEMETMVKSNLAAWLPPDTAKPLAALAGAVDVFSIWQWILLVLGFQIVGRVSRGKAVLLVAVVWGVWILGKVAMAAIL